MTRTNHTLSSPSRTAPPPGSRRSLALSSGSLALSRPLPPNPHLPPGPHHSCPDHYPAPPATPALPTPPSRYLTGPGPGPRTLYDPVALLRSKAGFNPDYAPADAPHNPLDVFATCGGPDGVAKTLPFGGGPPAQVLALTPGGGDRMVRVQCSPLEDVMATTRGDDYAERLSRVMPYGSSTASKAALYRPEEPAADSAIGRPAMEASGL